MNRRKMVLYLISAVLLMSTAPAVYAVGPMRGPLGIGLQLGEPLGVTASYWLNKTQTFDFAIGSDLDDDVKVTADFVIHDFSALRSAANPNGDLSFNYGFGAMVSGDDDDNFGIRGIVGLSYFFPSNPFEFYAELAPTLVLDEDVDGDLDGGVGFRFYF